MPDNIKLSELKTKNKKKKQVVINPTQIPKNIEREYQANIRKYNQTFKETIRKVLFPLIERYTNLLTTDGIGDDINTAIEAIKKEFDFIGTAERISNRMVERVNSVNGNKTMKTINNAIGVDVENIIRSENLTEFIELQTIKNAELIKSVPQDAVEDIRRIVLNGLSEGLRAEEIQRQISGNYPSSVFNKMNKRIATIARTETGKINSQITNKRLLNLGVTKAIWDATNDNRTRECHARRNGKEYDIAVGLYSSCDGKTIQPAEEINCRCVARPIIE
jgi:SPP1 gp7 family putative phage head morphogenesis protein